MVFQSLCFIHALFPGEIYETVDTVSGEAVAIKAESSRQAKQVLS